LTHIYFILDGRDSVLAFASLLGADLKTGMGAAIGAVLVFAGGIVLPVVMSKVLMRVSRDFRYIGFVD
jgi:hypothetical protein